MPTRIKLKKLLHLLQETGSDNSTGLAADDINAALQNVNIWRFLGRLKRETGVDLYMAVSTDASHTRKGSRFLIWPSVSHDQLGNYSSRLFRRCSLAELPSLYPSIEWDAYFSGLIPDDDKAAFFDIKDQQIVDVYLPKQLNEMGQKMALTVDTLDEITKVLIQRMESLIEETLIAVDGTRELFCAVALTRHAPSVIARVHFMNGSQDIMKWRQDIITMWRNIVSAFSFLLNGAEWVDESDKEKIQKKINDIRFYPGVPQWIMNDTLVTEEIYGYDPEFTLFENEILIEKAKFERSIRRAILDKRLEDLSFMPNAQYNAVGNYVRTQIGLFLPRKYHINYPLAVKYGGHGFILAHELMHSLDSHGAISAEPHLPDDWLQEKTIGEFRNRENCLIKQYSTYCVRERNVCVNGNRTISENIPDIDGLKIAYTAFKFASQVSGEDPPIPSLLNYSRDQLFFLAAGRFWCSKGFHEADFDDVHTPHKPRVDVMMRNVPVFARAFQCPVGSTYAPLKKCSVWGDVVSPARKH